jgi:hypothetical protein
VRKREVGGSRRKQEEVGGRKEGREMEEGGRGKERVPACLSQKFSRTRGSTRDSVKYKVFLLCLISLSF